MAERKTSLHFRVEINIDGRKLTEREQKALHKWASSLFSGMPEVRVNPWGSGGRGQVFEFSTARYWERERTKRDLSLHPDGEGR